MSACTLSEVQVNQALVGDALLFRQAFEVVNRLLIHADGDLLLHTFGVGVLDAVGKIIAITHGDHLHIVVVQKELICALR